MVEFDEGKPLIKITDFGLAKETTTTLAEVSVAGTPLLWHLNVLIRNFQQ